MAKNIKTKAVVIAAIFFFGMTVGILLGFCSVKSTHNPEVKEYSEPVTAVVNGEEMPIVSAKIFGDYVEIVTDGNEKIYVSDKNLVIYESEKYYNKEV